MYSLSKPWVVLWSFMLAGAASAQTGAADRCMAMATDAERLDCMRVALIEAERKLGEGHGSGPVRAGTSGGNDGEPAARQSVADLGAEQVAKPIRSAANAPDQLRLSATVTSFREHVPGQLRFVLDNGQVWQQSEADTQRLVLRPGKPFPVELWSTWSGGYRMLLVDEERVLRVERMR